MTCHPSLSSLNANQTNLQHKKFDSRARVWRTRKSWSSFCLHRTRNKSPQTNFNQDIMYLMYYIDPKTSSRHYTLQKQVTASLIQDSSPSQGEETGDGSTLVRTLCAHPARFSPDDKFSRERATWKKRWGLLPTQQAPLQL
jgi:hypothetical protein